MNKAVDSWIDGHREEIIGSLRTIVGFKSVSRHDCAETGAPFGPECARALEYALGLCRKFGFRDKNMGGYIGCADYGDGGETLGILTHLDVVPAGEGWSCDPYAADIKDGRMTGRGVLDDKGCAICSIYALAAVKAAGCRFRRGVRLMFGCDEEKGMGCLSHYLESGEKVPDMAFSPDASYPLVNSEKNIFHAAYKKEYPSRIRMKAGTVANAVPASASAAVPADAETVRAAADPGIYDVKPLEGGAGITARGAAAHASTPQDGRNAIQLMLGLLNRLPLEGEDAEAVSRLVGAFGTECHGESAGLDIEDESGRLTLNLGLMDWDEKGFSLTLDIRAPISVGEETLLSRLDPLFGAMGACREWHTFSPGHYVPEDGELVSALLNVYRERTGDMSGPKHIGGGTYARCFPNAVAFGPERDWRENRIHMADEAIDTEDLIQDAKLIADAIMALACK